MCGSRNIVKKASHPENLVPRASGGRHPPTSPGRPLKILLDHPGDVPI